MFGIIIFLDFPKTNWYQFVLGSQTQCKLAHLLHFVSHANSWPFVTWFTINKVTNKLITEQVPLGQQSAVMGVKQSGVQLAVFLAGATMPSAAASFGWRWAVAAAAAITFGCRWPVLVTAMPEANVR